MDIKGAKEAPPSIYLRQHYFEIKMYELSVSSQLQHGYDSLYLII